VIPYNRAAAAVRAILMDFDANFEAGSLDEAYLDVTDYCRQHGMTGKHLPRLDT
jgi:DNA polymerase kappa